MRRRQVAGAVAGLDLNGRVVDAEPSVQLVRGRGQKGVIRRPDLTR